MGSRFFSSALGYFRSLSYSKKITVLSVLVLVIALPAILFAVSQQENISSRADTSTIIEAESGTLSGNATLRSSDTASGGEYIQFIGPTQIPTPTTFQPPTPTPTPQPPTPTFRPIATFTPRPKVRPTAITTPRPTSRPTQTPTPGHGNGKGNGNNQ